jgi:cytochrome c oxidase subunit 4
MTRVHVSHRIYVVVWVALLALTTLTFFLSTRDLGALEVPVALAIALVKAGLVALFFMHLIEQRAVNRAYIVVAALFVVLIVGLMIGDVALRDPRADVEPEPSAATTRLPR